MLGAASVCSLKQSACVEALLEQKGQKLLAVHCEMDHEMRVDVPQAVLQNRLLLRDPTSIDPSFSHCYQLSVRLTASDYKSIFQYRVRPVQTRARPAGGTSRFHFLLLLFSCPKSFIFVVGFKMLREK